MCAPYTQGWQGRFPLFLLLTLVTCATDPPGKQPVTSQGTDDTENTDSMEPQDGHSTDSTDTVDVPPQTDGENAPDGALEDVGDTGNALDTSVAPDEGTSDTHSASDAIPPGDTGPQDTGPQDTGPQDTGPQDTGPQDTGPQEIIEDPPLWLVSIDNAAKQLQRVNVETGATTNICTIASGSVLFGSYPSTTFSRNNVLFASHNGTSLDIINPCTCAVAQVGSYGGWSGVNGITSDQATDLFGVASTQDEVITIATSSGLGTKVGNLGVNFGTGGATWSDTANQLYAINGTDDSLYLVDPNTGIATKQADLTTPLGTTKDFGTVGIELHPQNDILYACSSDAVLLEVDQDTGVVTEVGPMYQQGSCTNLAAPWAPVPCLEP